MFVTKAPGFAENSKELVVRFTPTSRSDEESGMQANGSAGYDGTTASTHLVCCGWKLRLRI